MRGSALASEICIWSLSTLRALAVRRLSVTRLSWIWATSHAIRPRHAALIGCVAAARMRRVPANRHSRGAQQRRYWASTRVWACALHPSPQSGKSCCLFPSLENLTESDLEFASEKLPAPSAGSECIPKWLKVFSGARNGYLAAPKDAGIDFSVHHCRRHLSVTWIHRSRLALTILYFIACERCIEPDSSGCTVAIRNRGSIASSFTDAAAFYQSRDQFSSQKPKHNASGDLDDTTPPANDCRRQHGCGACLRGSRPRVADVHTRPRRAQRHGRESIRAPAVLAACGRLCSRVRR